MATIVLIVVVVGWQFVVPIDHQHVAIREIERLGGSIHPRIRHQVGDEQTKLLDDVVEVNLDNTLASDATLSNVVRLTGLQIILIDSTQVGDAGVAELQRALPGLMIDR